MIGSMVCADLLVSNATQRNPDLTKMPQVSPQLPVCGERVHYPGTRALGTVQAFV